MRSPTKRDDEEKLEIDTCWSRRSSATISKRLRMKSNPRPSQKITEQTSKSVMTAEKKRVEWRKRAVTGIIDDEAAAPSVSLIQPIWKNLQSRDYRVSKAVLARVWGASERSHHPLELLETGFPRPVCRSRSPKVNNPRGAWGLISLTTTFKTLRDVLHTPSRGAYFCRKING